MGGASGPFNTPSASPRGAMDTSSQRNFWGAIQGDSSTVESPAQTVDGMGAVPPQDKETLSFFGAVTRTLLNPF